MPIARVWQGAGIDVAKVQNENNVGKATDGGLGIIGAELHGATPESLFQLSPSHVIQ